MDDGKPFICDCKKCNGVFDGFEAAQYVWEWALGSCGVPTVVGVNVGADGFVCCAWTYWDGEPEVPGPLSDLTEFMISCRPGEGTVPTEGDVARWMQWQARPAPPRDWVLVDGTRCRSVAQVVDALRARHPMPEEITISGDWIERVDTSWRDDIRRDWETTRRWNAARG